MFRRNGLRCRASGLLDGQTGWTDAGLQKRRWQSAAAQGSAPGCDARFKRTCSRQWQVTRTSSESRTWVLDEACGSGGSHPATRVHFVPALCLERIAPSSPLDSCSEVPVASTGPEGPPTESPGAESLASARPLRPHPIKADRMLDMGFEPQVRKILQPGRRKDPNKFLYTSSSLFSWVLADCSYWFTWVFLQCSGWGAGGVGARHTTATRKTSLSTS